MCFLGIKLSEDIGIYLTIKKVNKMTKCKFNTENHFSSIDNSQNEKKIELYLKEGKMEKMKQKFLLYSKGRASEKELNEASFNFLGFVRTVMNIANDNDKKG